MHSLGRVDRRRVDALLLDFDGLILDTESAEYHALVEVFAGFGAHLGYEEWRSSVGHVSPDWLARLADPGSAAYVRAGELFTSLCERRSRGLRLRPGVEELLEFASTTQIPVAIVTSATEERLMSQLADRDIISQLAAYVTLETTRRPKPSPGPYLAALRMLDIDAHHAVAFEDSARGVTAAKAAGVRCVAVYNDVTYDHDFGEADLVVDDICRVDLQALERGELAGYARPSRPHRE